jgi:hypothetical protein
MVGNSNRRHHDFSAEILGLRKRDFIAHLWKAFVDDSADQHRRQFVVAGALFGIKSGWSNFNKQWRKALHENPRIEYFHGSELRRLDGEFLQFRDADKWPKPEGGRAANAKRDALRAVVERSSDVVLYGVGVLVPEYERIRSSHPRGVEFMAKDPFEYVLQLLIHRVTETVAGLDGKAKVGFISDDSSKAAVYSKVYSEWKTKNPNTAQFMAGIGHMDDKDVYGLQAADMAASVVKGSFELLVKGESLETGFPLEEKFWRVEVHREANLLKTLETQPADTVKLEDNGDHEETPDSPEFAKLTEAMRVIMKVPKTAVQTEKKRPTK